SRVRVALCPHPLYDNFGEPLPQAEAQRQLGLESGYRYLLFFGFIRDYKGLDLLMRAYADTRLRKEKVRLLVAGEFYNNAEQYAQLETELGLQGQIVWHTQFIPNDQVRVYFSAADLIVQPYKSATQSGVTQVAYHFSKPMLVTDVGGLAEIVPNGKVGYVTPVDDRAIADALLDFCHREAHCFDSGIEEEKRKYAWSKMTAAVMER
ncbi:MAG: glycosyltransferase, partial [Paludibacteraceae bacterium]|nr:glycosyltransferase [Paludibacteraceae bacterium]